LQERNREPSNEQLIARPCRSKLWLACGDAAGEVAGDSGLGCRRAKRQLLNPALEKKLARVLQTLALGTLGRGLRFSSARAGTRCRPCSYVHKGSTMRSEREKNTRQPCRKLHQNVGGLRAKNVFRDPAPKAAPRPSLFGRCIRITSTMSKRHEHVNDQEQIDEQVHRDGEYDKQMTNVE